MGLKQAADVFLRNCLISYLEVDDERFSLKKLSAASLRQRLKICGRHGWTASGERVKPSANLL